MNEEAREALGLLASYCESKDTTNEECLRNKILPSLSRAIVGRQSMHLEALVHLWKRQSPFDVEAKITKGVSHYNIEVTWVHKVEGGIEYTLIGHLSVRYT